MSIELVPAISSGDLAALTRIPGVGKKTAERIVLELRDKLAAMEIHEPTRIASPAGPVADVLSALINLGYEAPRRGSRRSKTLNVPSGRDFEELLKAALQKLAIARGTRARGRTLAPESHERDEASRQLTSSPAKTGHAACISGQAYDEDARIESSVRPKKLSDFIGQSARKRKSLHLH